MTVAAASLSDDPLLDEIALSYARQDFEEFSRYLRPHHHLGWFHRRLAQSRQNDFSKWLKI